MRIIQPIMHSVLHGAHIDETCLDEKSFALLKEIQKTLSVFDAPSHRRLKTKMILIFIDNIIF